MNLGAKNHPRVCVEDCYTLNIGALRKAFELGPDPRGYVKLHGLSAWDLSRPPWREEYRFEARSPVSRDWPDGYPLTLTMWHIDYDERLLAVRMPDGDEEELGWDEVPWSFGGVRRWWLCSSCERRCSKLHFLPGWRGSPGCRECLGLAYRAENLSKVNRKIDRFWRQANRHGIRNGTLSTYFEKPRWQHWRSYDRDRARLRELEVRMLKAIVSLQRVR